MSLTLYGKVLDRTASAMSPGSCHAYDLSTLERALDGPVPVDFDHSHEPIGEVIYAETSEAGLLAVAVVDDVDELVDVPDVYFSGEFYCIANRGANWVGHHPRLLSLGLTLAPAALGLTPVKMVQGDVRRSIDRYCWPMSWKTSHPLLERSVEVCERRHRGDPLYIADRVPRPELQVRRTFHRLEQRSASTADVRFADRVVELIAAPYERATTIYELGRSYVEEFAYAAFRGEEKRAAKVRVNRDHDHQRTVGRVVSLDPLRHEGLVAELHLSRTVLGDESLELAADGCLDASVSFGVPAGGDEWFGNRSRRRIRKAFLGDHIALTPVPAYEDAVVLGARSIHH